MEYNEHEKKRMLKIAKRILICIVRNRAEEMETIDLNLSLNNDLGLHGDDVDDLLNDINRYIEIDWSSLNFKEYFYEEGDISFRRGFFLFLYLPFFLLSLIIERILKFFRIDSGFYAYKISYFNKNKRPFVVGDLIIAAYSGKWENLSSRSIPVEAELKYWQSKFQTRFERKYRRKK
ncbi:DUF1493 family protein [Leptospira sp. 201903071]|uniref:DUF1493 family protein n=1 Tax=Leptospira ainazelensis TaxID=2810034 RepID=UPI001965728D|nr:DUF1493 family protein [Leptospira ainazelensis]MBM9500124.1 DUF1493 family protein [Leptospira ainazelensis]